MEFRFENKELEKLYSGHAIKVDGDTVWIGQMKTTLEKARHLIKK